MKSISELTFKDKYPYCLTKMGTVKKTVGGKYRKMTCLNYQPDNISNLKIGLDKNFGLTVLSKENSTKKTIYYLSKTF